MLELVKSHSTTISISGAVTLDNSIQTHMERLLMFVEKSEMKCLNCCISFIQENQGPKVVVAFRNTMQKQDPSISLKILFPNALREPKTMFLRQGVFREETC